jgi:phosphoribosylaminoimidazole-succinocarboxamide synthase
MEFRDDVTANNGEKHEVVPGKGVTTCAFNAAIMDALASAFIWTHYLGPGSAPNTAVVQRLTMIPLECVVRNRTAGSFCRRLGVETGRELKDPLYELFYKSDELNDPLITEQTAVVMGWATESQLKQMRSITLRVNTAVSVLLRDKGIELVDFKIEFGVNGEGKLLVGNEFTPDSCRMWDVATGKTLDKDLFRQGHGGFLEAYREALGRVSSASASDDA